MKTLKPAMTADGHTGRPLPGLHDKPSASPAADQAVRPDPNPGAPLLESDLEARARRAFDAYNEQGPNPWKTWDNKDVPRWPDLTDQVRAKWCAAVAVLSPAPLPIIPGGVSSNEEHLARVRTLAERQEVRYETGALPTGALTDADKDALRYVLDLAQHPMMMMPAMSGVTLAPGQPRLYPTQPPAPTNVERHQVEGLLLAARRHAEAIKVIEGAVLDAFGGNPAEAQRVMECVSDFAYGGDAPAAGVDKLVELLTYDRTHTK